MRRQNIHPSPAMLINNIYDNKDIVLSPVTLINNVKGVILSPVMLINNIMGVILNPMTLINNIYVFRYTVFPLSYFKIGIG